MAVEKDKVDIKELSIQNAKSGNKSDLTGGIVEFSYYESILSNHVSATMTVSDTGNTVGEGKDKKDLLNGLPVRGGEPVRLRALDQSKNKIEFTGDNAFYVNRVKNGLSDTTRNTVQFDLCTKEFIANEQTRVVSRYSGKISESIKKILKTRLKTKNYKDSDIEETANSYNFIGNDRKPFYVLTWLATKSIPSDGAYGKTAGYLFFENKDGFQFKSIETLIGTTEGGGSSNQKQVKKFEYTNTDKKRDGFEKIQKYNINSNIDLQEKLTIGAYNNRTLFFDPFEFKVKEVDFDISKQKNKVKSSGTEIDFVAEEFRTGSTRFMTNILDVGTLPGGKDAAAQLSEWKSNPANTNDKVRDRMVQSIMRYNQIFSVNVDILIKADFSLKAGDTIYCEFPGVGAETKEVSKETSGYYLIASLCHKITSSDAYTSINLVRDSFGKKSVK